ncbi:MAG: hypothetical protein EKK33_01335 [Bradyrhizobiaceae bacterium]|nr:MAG: hypothetical protein EKK33_01335 [Bradyrhizobiaceae bacterium]
MAESRFSKRCELTVKVVDEAVAKALEGKTARFDYCDESQPYFVLRVRGHSLSWLVKTRDKTIKIGNAMPPQHRKRLPERRMRASKVGDEDLGLRDARQSAKLEWAKLGNQVEEPEKKPCWTWDQLVEGYKTYISGMREDARGQPVYPSNETQNDVRLIFARPEVAKHANRLLNHLGEQWFEDVQEALHEAYGFDAYRKFRSYGRAALNWAQKFKRKESGLDGRRWWQLAEERRRTSTEVAKKIVRTRELKKKKADFKVEHLGKLLVEHEKFCLSRTGNERISPGVRWGFWWDCLTGHRRGSGTWIARKDIDFKDPRLPKGWGLATWQPEVMKSQNEFTLPIPPLGLHIIRCCLRDVEEASKRVVKNLNSPWIFTSRVVQSDAGIIPVSGSALANHIRNMRGLRKEHGGNHRDILKGIPPFSMHIIRSTLGDYILDETNLPPGVASLMIAHEIAGDHKSEMDKVGDTGRRWYFQAQRIPEKLKAMELWSEALLKAFDEAGGLHPR